MLGSWWPHSPYQEQASVPGDHCRNSTKPVADIVLSSQELSAGFVGLLSSGAESSEHMTWASCDIPQPHTFYKMEQLSQFSTTGEELMSYFSPYHQIHLGDTLMVAYVLLHGPHLEGPV